MVGGGRGVDVEETTSIFKPVAVSPQPSFYSLSIYPCGDLLAVGGLEIPGVGDRWGWESQHSVTQPERRQIAPIKRQAASSDLTSAAVSGSGDRDKFSLSIGVRNQQECPVKNESSPCLNGAVTGEYYLRRKSLDWGEHFFLWENFFFASTTGQWVTIPQRVCPHFNQIKQLNNLWGDSNHSSISENNIA